MLFVGQQEEHPACKKTWAVGYWHGYLSGARCRLAWPSWYHCHSPSLASVKSRLVLPFWYRLTRVVPEKGPLNGCVCVSAIAKRPARWNWAVDTEIDDYCDKLVVNSRSSEVLSTELTNDSAVYHALSVHLSRAKSLTHSNDRYTKTN